MQRLVTLVVVAALALAACSSSETAGSDTVPSTQVTVANTPDTSTTSTPDSPETPISSAATDTGGTTTSTVITVPNPPSAVSQDDLVRFVAATEVVLKGTPSQGIVSDAPEIYIAIAQSACARFTAGETFEQVSNDLLAELAGSSPADDNRLVGAILGAASRTICPEHAGLI